MIVESAQIQRSINQNFLLFIWNCYDQNGSFGNNASCWQAIRTQSSTQPILLCWASLLSSSLFSSTNFTSTIAVRKSFIYSFLHSIVANEHSFNAQQKSTFIGRNKAETPNNSAKKPISPLTYVKINTMLSKLNYSHPSQLSFLLAKLNVFSLLSEL